MALINWIIVCSFSHPSGQKLIVVPFGFFDHQKLSLLCKRCWLRMMVIGVQYIWKRGPL